MKNYQTVLPRNHLQYMFLFNKQKMASLYTFDFHKQSFPYLSLVSKQGTLYKSGNEKFRSGAQETHLMSRAVKIKISLFVVTTLLNQKITLPFCMSFFFYNSVV